MGRQSEVGMYLVGNYHSPVLLTDIRYPAQLPGCPDTPAGIMRITKNKRPAPLNVLSETLEINVIMPVMQIKRRVNDFTSHTFGHQKEGWYTGVITITLSPGLVKHCKAKACPRTIPGTNVSISRVISHW